MGTADSLELSGKLISIEKRGMNNLLPKHNVSVHVLTRLGDLITNPNWFDYYIEVAEDIFFIGKSFSSKRHSKIKYVGNPKYDALMTRESCISSLGLDSNERYITVFYPEHQFKPQFKMVDLYKKIIDCGYKVLVKNRCITVPSLYEKSPEIEGVVLYDDEQMYPSKSLELMTVSDLSIMFNSAAVEESLYAETPFMNFSKGPPFMPYLYDKSYSENLPSDFNLNLISDHVDRLVSQRPKESIKKVKYSTFACVGNSSETILNYIFK